MTILGECRIASPRSENTASDNRDSVTETKRITLLLFKKPKSTLLGEQ